MTDIYESAATGPLADSLTASVGSESAAQMIKDAVSGELKNAGSLVEQSATQAVQSIAAPVEGQAISALEGVAGNLAESILGSTVSDALSSAESAVTDTVSDAASSIADIFGEPPLTPEQERVAELARELDVISQHRILAAVVSDTVVTAVGAGVGGALGYFIFGPVGGVIFAIFGALQPQVKRGYHVPR